MPLTPTRCPKHPTYRGVMPPRADCPVCEAIYASNPNAKTPEQIVDRKLERVALRQQRGLATPRLNKGLIEGLAKDKNGLVVKKSID